MSYLYVLLLRLIAYLEGKSKIFAFLLLIGFLLFSITINFLGKSRTIGYLLYIVLGALGLSIILFIHTVWLSKLNLRDVAVITAYFLWFFYTCSKFWNRSLNYCLRYLLYSFLIYNVTNLVIYEMYYADIPLGINSIMKAFGIYGYRVYFPLASGANINTAQIGLCTILVAYFIKSSKDLKLKLFYGFLGLLHFYLLVLADSRLVLFITFIFSISILISFYHLIVLIKRYWILVISTLSLVLIVFYSTDIFEFLKRPGESDSKFIDRIQIWKISIEVIFHDWHFISGYGLNGLENNLPRNILTEFKDQSLQTSHNFIFQYLIDFGVIGLVFFILGMQQLVQWSYAYKNRIILYLIIAIIIFGATESIPTFYSFEATLFFIGIIAIVTTRKLNEGENLRYST
ncbi:MAG: hypothetical protein CL868_07080 [Cytophagaceae bacterium]|nr:hypothetical protein [Cytophagaceae bacterium]|tara:strand:- start:48795 stop:49997 length:1203 start_codon:yes stop_codon:yes gene_type:complete